MDNTKLATIASAFDNNAGTYEESLEKRPYFSHLRLLELWQSSPRQNSLKMLDLGCGTGLAGQLFADLKNFKEIAGVDLSAGMLQEAQKRGIYQTLFQTDGISYLTQALNVGNVPYDLILAAGLFAYIEQPETLFALIKNALCKQGVLLFSFDRHDFPESLDKPVLRSLTNLLGFTYSPRYIQRALEKHGFTITHFESIVDRMSWGTNPKPIVGCIVQAII